MGFLKRDGRAGKERAIMGRSLQSQWHQKGRGAAAYADGGNYQAPCIAVCTLCSLGSQQSLKREQAVWPHGYQGAPMAGTGKGHP